MKKVLLTAAAALAVFGSASVLADNGKGSTYVSIDVVDQITGETTEQKLGEAKKAAEDMNLYTDGRTAGVYKEDNSTPATIGEAEAANSARLAKQSLLKTAANGQKAAAKDGKKMLPNTGAVK